MHIFTRAPTRVPLVPALAALVLHAGLLWVLVRMVERDRSTGPAALPMVHLLSQLPSGGGGHGGATDLPRLQATVTPPSSPAPTPEAPVDTSAVPSDDGAAADASGGGGGNGGGMGSGSGTGAGPGSNQADSVPPDRSAPPRPRQEVLPPLDYPRALRGRSVDVTFWIGADGRVERVEVQPPLEDARFQRSFLEAMRRHRFHPARGPDGGPAPGTWSLTITF